VGFHHANHPLALQNKEWTSLNDIRNHPDLIQFEAKIKPDEPYMHHNEHPVSSCDTLICHMSIYMRDTAIATPLSLSAKFTLRIDSQQN
jgi:hypothetical protein